MQGWGAPRRFSLQGPGPPSSHHPKAGGEGLHLVIVLQREVPDVTLHMSLAMAGHMTPPNLKGTEKCHPATRVSGGQRMGQNTETDTNKDPRPMFGEAARQL